MRITHRVCFVAATLMGIVAFDRDTNATTLVNIATDDVATTYTFPQMLEPGILSLSDLNLGVLATFLDAPGLALGDVSLSLDVEFLSEVGDPNDALAHGQFGGGVLTLTDESDGPGTTIFQATITGFDLMEVVAGSFVGAGSFVDAIYGGALSAVTLPTEGQLFTALFDWHEGSFDGPLSDIDNFLSHPGGDSQVYADMHDLTIVPEPSTVMLLAIGAFASFRRRS